MNNISDPFEFEISTDILVCIGNLTELTNLCDPCYEYQKALNENYTATEITKCSLGCFDRLYYYHLQKQYYPGNDFILVYTMRLQLTQMFEMF